MILVTSHAAARFMERVRPGLDYEAAKKELQRLLDVSSLVPTPDWAAPRLGSDQACVGISDGLVAVCEFDGDRCTAVTVLVRQGHPRNRPRKRRKRRLLGYGR